MNEPTLNSSVPIPHPSHQLVLKTHCAHELRYCEDCDTVYCSKCNREWVKKVGRIPQPHGTPLPFPNLDPTFWL
jgi:hypothetical protein